MFGQFFETQSRKNQIVSSLNRFSSMKKAMVSDSGRFCMKIVPKLFVLLMYIALAIAFSTEAFAQWGTGMYGGMQQCAYRAEVGDEAMDIQDDINEMVASKNHEKEFNLNSPIANATLLNCQAKSTSSNILEYIRIRGKQEETLVLEILDPSNTGGNTGKKLDTLKITARVSVSDNRPFDATTFGTFTGRRLINVYCTVVEPVKP
jgi:hypothetical protein